MCLLLYTKNDRKPLTCSLSGLWAHGLRNNTSYVPSYFQVGALGPWPGAQCPWALFGGHGSHWHSSGSYEGGRFWRIVVYYVY